MNDKIKVIIIGSSGGHLADAIAHCLPDKLASIEEAVVMFVENDRKRTTKEDIEQLMALLDNPKTRFSAPAEVIMELQAMPEMMQPIVLKDDKPSANMGAYRGYKSHPTKASDRKRFERFNKKRR